MAIENNQKLDASLNLALDIALEDREKSQELGTGFEEEQIWRVIVKYIGDLSQIEKQVPESQGIPLLNQYGIIRVPESQIDKLASLPQIQYVEKPKQVYFSLDEGRSASCINSIQARPGNQGWEPGQNIGLTGRGVIVGIADSGIDITHPAFLNPDGSTRILYLWDQTKDSLNTEGLLPPQGYSGGVEYTEEMINRLIKNEAPEQIPFPGESGTGHGTAVAGIAVGNGNGSSGNRYRGVAIESSLIVVRLGVSGEGFPRTTEVMEALDYMMKKAISLQLPIAINLSFGNNYGAHNGQSLLEGYITDLAGVWKNTIVVASGNEGDARHHAKVNLNSEMKVVPIAIAENEQNLSLQIWKNYADDFAVFIEAPNGVRLQINRTPGNSEQYSIEGNRLLIYYGEPTPYTLPQEIYMEWIPLEEQSFLTEGIWKVLLIPEKIVDGTVDFWLPTIEAVGLSTGFLQPDTETTLTVPASARKIITVGAYNAANDTLASFSGRGNTLDGRNMPTIVAPGVDVITASAGGGYTGRTGTSMAAPFVTGSAALLMEWGIVRGNDPFLYGEKMKAYFIKGARPLPGVPVPSVTQGWGALCVEQSLPKQ